MSRNEESSTTTIPNIDDDDETDTTESQNDSRPLSEDEPNVHAFDSLTPDSVYDFYMRELLPAILSSLPILVRRIWKDALSWALMAAHEFCLFIQPKWMKEQLENSEGTIQMLLLGGENGDHNDWRRSPNVLVQQLWEQAVQSSKNVNATIADFMLNNFDRDNDGQISTNELLNMTELLAKLPITNPLIVIQQQQQQQQQPVGSFWAWFSREWPLMDWKIGIFLWQTFGGILFVIAVLSIMPGYLHTWSAKVLRWPILGLTYFLINIELVVYISIRLAIRFIETLVATPKHRALRYKMANCSNSYQEWYQYAAELDRSQKRNVWKNTTADETSTQYNWPLIQQLIVNMREARLTKKDPMLALAVLQQCTRKNVGGIMNEDLFTKTYTGEPKFIVMEFIDEVTKTLNWVTDQTLLLEEEAAEEQKRQNSLRRLNSMSYDKKFKEKSRMERQKLWRSLVAFATLDFGAGDDKPNINKMKIDASKAAPSKRDSSTENIFDRSSSTRSNSSDSSNSSSVSPLVTKKQLLRFLKRAQHSYGKTALCLSGGGMMGLYHLGHLKGLMETDCLPEIVSGCSAGSVIGAILCTRTKEELVRDLDPLVIGPKLHCFDRKWSDRLKSVWKTGTIFDGEYWLNMIRWFTCGDITFEEAYQKTGRVFSIALSSTAKKTPPILINYISAPNVTIASAVCASAAVPGFIHPQQLQCKDPIDGKVKSAGPETYFDGSIRHDIPTAGLSEMLNCHFFVACQCNPHIVPFFFNSKGGVGMPTRWSGGEQETSWRGGFLLAALEMYLKNDMKAKFVFLDDLDAAVSFTGTMMTQSFVGTTTIVPKVELRDFFVLFSDPSISRLYHYFKVGSVAAYQHAAMIRCHYRVADALEACIEKLESETSANVNSRNKASTEAEWIDFETPKKKRVSRSGGFEEGGTIFGSSIGDSSIDSRNTWKRHPMPTQDHVPEIVTSDNNSNGIHKPLRSGDGDSVSTSSETFVPPP